jgi:mRNA interferase MazF
MTDARLIHAGDIYMVDLDPIRGSEQSGIRPVLVISSDLMHLKSKRIIICPITGNKEFWTTKVPLPENAKTAGMVLTDQVRAVGRQERILRYVETLAPDFVTLVRSYVGRLLELEVRLP